MSDAISNSNHFFIPNEKREYDIEVDRAIFHELNLSESVSSGQLKKRIEEYLGRMSITPAVYYEHLNRMVSENDLDKKDTRERGKRVFYSLTKNAKREWRLNIHRVNKEHILFRKIYERLFLYEFEHTPFVISTEEEFCKVLQSGFNTTIQELDWYWTANAENHVIVQELYKYSNSSRRHQEYHKEDMEEYWNRRRGQSTIFEEVVFICAIFIGKTKVWITKTEYWEINKNGKHRKYDTVYSLELPGVAVKEFINDRFVNTLNFKEEDVNRAVALLVNEGLLKPCMIFRDEIRYEISDPRLGHLLENIRNFHRMEFNYLLSKWEDFDKPTEKEKERVEWLLGKQESDRIFRLAEMKRHSIKVLMKTSNSLDEYHNRYLTEFMVPRFVTAEYYNAYLQGKVVPSYDKSKLSIHEYRRYYFELDEYKERRGSTKKPKQDISDFHKFLRGKLMGSERTLKYEAECLKLANSDVLEEYRFLHDAIKMICPLVFQAPDTELQTDTIHGDLLRYYEHRELAKKLMLCNWECTPNEVK